MTSPTTEPLLLDQAEACRLLGGIDRTTLWRMRKRGELVTVRIGTRTFVTGASLEAYVCSESQSG